MRRVKFKVVALGSQRRSSAFASGKYNLDYAKGTTVRAREETLGVAVFKTRRDAERFIRRTFTLLPFQVIHVRPVGRGMIVRSICDPLNESSLDSFYNKNPRYFCTQISPPLGTIFYPAVEVLD